MVVNTYTRRYSKSTSEGDLRNDRALVVWVDVAKKGDIYSDEVQIGDNEGQYYDPPYNEESAKDNALDM